MPNTKISALTADTAPTADDLVVTVNDPGGTPATRKATITNFTKAIPAVVGDSGSGGTKGLVPAPAAGDAAAGKFLKADGTFAVPSGGTPGAHASSHQNGGGDEISVAGLSGVLADPQVPITENVQDIIGAAVVAGTGISVSYNDGTGETTVTNTATGSGDVVGPGSAADNALARFDSATGKIIQNSTVTLDDTGAITVPEMAAPSTPASGKVSIYAKSDGKVYIKDDAGTETDLTAAGSGISGLTTGQVPKAASSTTLADSLIADDGSHITLGTAARLKFTVVGTSPMIKPSSGFFSLRNVADSAFVDLETAILIAYFGSTAKIKLDTNTGFGLIQTSDQFLLWGSSSSSLSSDTGIGRDSAGIVKVALGSNPNTIISPLKTDTFGATMTVNLAQGNVHQITLTANITSLTISNQKAGGEYTLILKQDATGSRTVAWPASVKWAGGAAPTLSGASKTDVVKFVSDGTNLYEVARSLNM